MHRFYFIAGWGYAAICTTLMLRATLASPAPVPLPAGETTSTRAPAVAAVGNAQEWFRRVKPYCNAVELKFVTNPPQGWQGSGYHAACFALAGRIDDARKVIDQVEETNRFRAAGIVFTVGHPVADAGDDRAAGPIMELVIDYWPDHYMALYHAGIAEYMLGQSALAKKNLENFLRIYKEEDGWRNNARDILNRLDNPNSAAAQDLRRPVEP